MQVMQINPISFINQIKMKQLQCGTSLGLKMQEPLKQDTISFEGSVKFEQFVEKTAQKNNEKLLAPATIYMDILESIAMKLQNLGVSFDRNYCEPNAIKSAKSVISKIKRSKTFIIPDRIRGTLFCKNIYDLSILFNNILPELAKRGYNIASTEVSIQDALRRGYIPNDEELSRGFVIYPDMDIRLDNIFVQAEALPENMKYSLSKPQPSGYEDIQIRFKKTNGIKNDVLHELIIIVGSKYAEAKHDESNMIYNYTRQFKELNLFNKSKNSDETIAMIKRYTDLITKIFSTEISQKVYENAKSYDIFGIKTPMPISLSGEDEKILTGYYDSIEKLTKEYYKKTIEEKSKNEKVQNTLKKERKEDLERLANIRKGLTEAVDFYRNQYNKTSSSKKK